MNVTIHVDRMTDNDRALLTYYYRHWNIIPRNMECIGYRDGKPIFRPILEDVTEG